MNNSNQENNLPVSNYWEKLEVIRRLLAPTLTNDEFELFTSLGRKLEADPFAREIWAVKYDAKLPAQIFCGINFYRRKAEEQPNYDGHVVDSVYQNDVFEVRNGVPHHSYSIKDRGKLIGAYCVVYVKGRSIPYYVFVSIDEYNKGFGLWKSMPATMIKKVAEAQALRGAFQGLFNGTYEESEAWDSSMVAPATVSPTVEVTEVEATPVTEDKGAKQQPAPEEKATKVASKQMETPVKEATKKVAKPVLSTSKEVDELPQELRELEKIGLKFEMKNGWVAVSNGYPHRSLLTSLGFKFHPESKKYIKKLGATTAPAKQVATPVEAEAVAEAVAEKATPPAGSPEATKTVTSKIKAGAVSVATLLLSILGAR